MDDTLVLPHLISRATTSQDFYLTFVHVHVHNIMSVFKLGPLDQILIRREQNWISTPDLWQGEGLEEEHRIGIVTFIQCTQASLIADELSKYSI